MINLTRTIFKFSTLPFVVVRHGQTVQNHFKQWAGWMDAKLSPKGEQEARQCGRILKKSGLQFDLTYSSMLSRSIKTLNLILDEMDSHFIPLEKRWELNQKCYGAFQGLDKLKIVDVYGEAMVNEWRRSLVVAPPKMFQDDPRHPIHDRRYKDIDRKLLPSTQNVGDVLQRVRNLYEQEIKNELLRGKKVLIVCHGSPVRAWTNIIMKIDEAQSKKFKVPNATPLLLHLDRNDLSIKSWQLLGDNEVIKQRMIKLQRQLKRQAS